MLNRNKKLMISLLAASLFVSAGIMLAVWRTQPSTSNEPATKEGNYVDDKDQSLTNNPATSSDEKTLPPSNDTAAPNQNVTPEKLSITRAETSGEYLRISAISSSPSSGDCILKLEKQGYTTITETAGIIVGPNYYTCDGFRVPLSKLPAKGEWSVSVIHQVGDQSSASDVKNVVIN